MIIEETNNSEQYEVFNKDDEDTVIDVVINRKRFREVMKLHVNKYSDGDHFWTMFERDLFDTDK